MHLIRLISENTAQKSSLTLEKIMMLFMWCCPRRVIFTGTGHSVQMISSHGALCNNAQACDLWSPPVSIWHTTTSHFHKNTSAHGMMAGNDGKSVFVRCEVSMRCVGVINDNLGLSKMTGISLLLRSGFVCLWGHIKTFES